MRDKYKLLVRIYIYKDIAEINLKSIHVELITIDLSSYFFYLNLLKLLNSNISFN